MAPMAGKDEIGYTKPPSSSLGSRAKRTTGKSDVILGLADGAPNDGEARFEQSTVEVGGHGAIPATLPETVLALETLFPHGFDGFIVGLEQLE